MTSANLVVTLFDGTYVADDRVADDMLLSATGEPERTQALRALASGIRANPLWSRLPGARLIARSKPEPLLVVVGAFDKQQQLLLGELKLQIDLLMHEREIVDYAHAESVCRRMANRLLEAFGRELLQQAQFAAIPRGGWIVLGMLSYCLGLRKEQLTTLDAASADGTLFIVDDCSLSGVRFRESLGSTAANSVVFCPLYAPRALCEAIVAKEPRVVDCLAGADIRDTSPGQGDAEYAAWKQRRLAQVGSDAYWLGQPLGVAFAWCSPQTRRWDDIHGRFEEGWNVVPTSRCLQRRLLLQRLESDIDADYLPALIINSPPSGVELAAADRVLWCDRGSDVVVASVPLSFDEPSNAYVLEGISAEFWRLLMSHGSLDRAVQTLLERYQVARTQLEADLAVLAEQMCVEGLLVDRAASPCFAGSVDP